MRNAVVIFSGGQDSTTCLFSALKTYDAVWTIGFSYGQRHQVELQCRAAILTTARNNPVFSRSLREDVLMDIPAFSSITHSALMSDDPICQGPSGLPTSFVPARNLIFITLAAAYAYERHADTIILGVSSVDYSGYPDCREDTMESMTRSLSLGLDTPMHIVCPLMHKTKGETWQLAFETGGRDLVDFILEASHTCYLGERRTRYKWGYGCGECPSCRLRARGFEDFLRSPSGRKYAGECA